MTKADMVGIQKAESFRDRRRKAIMQNAPDGDVAGLMIAEAEALLDTVSGIRRRLEKGVER